MKPIIDSSFISDWSRCKRYCYFSKIRGLQPIEPNLDLVFGSAWHEGVEYLMIQKDAGMVHHLQIAYERFMSVYRASFGPESDEMNKAKNPEGATFGLVEYARYYQAQDMNHHLYYCNNQPAIELGGYTPINAAGDKFIAFKIDAIVIDKEGKFWAIDFKTTRNLSQVWAEGWKIHHQFQCYNHVLACAFGADKVGGTIVRGFSPSIPRLKQNGEPYANSVGPRFQDVIIRYDLDRQDTWILDTQQIIREVNDELKLLEVTKNEHFMVTFQRNPTNCTKYNRICQYAPYCQMTCSEYTNPALLPDEAFDGFKVDHFDPTEGKLALEVQE